MQGCLENLDNDNWDGAECVPNNGNGTQIGPTFGFYKSHDSYFTDAQDCYNQCEDCLARGITAMWAVTTHCDYEANHFGPGIKSHCGMGFDYGT